MSRYEQRTENALKRANEFIEVGELSRALDILYKVFKNKKWLYNLSKSVLEPIMFKYLDLCVDLKKSHIAKEGLFQYMNMFQSVNVGSLENVIRGYLRTAEERTEAAREQSQQAIVDIDDLDNLAMPESILLSAVSGEDAQEHSDRTILTPWVKFLWESYCQCLELLRTNAHVEALYHDIARMAFQFCLKYNRKTEFRKLCDKLRKHLKDISKLPPKVANVSLNKPETQQFNLDTRLVKLDSAIQMELWQEVYKATEDIHGLMSTSKKQPVPKTMANYYQKLAMVFWKTGYYLFHAAAHFKLFQLSKDMKKNITPEELQRMACRVLLATLAIPLPSAHPEFDRFIETDKSPLEKAQRLAVLLTLPQPPTRASLLKDIVRLNVVGLATPQLQELYNCLEIDFNPLTLCKRVQAVTDSLQGQGDEQYIPPLQDVTLVRLIRQVSQVYQTIKFSQLLELAHFTTPFHLERLLGECVRHNDMQIRIEHGTGCVHFGIDLSESQREDKPEGPTLHSMPSEQVHNQLINMSTVLTKVMQIINLNANKAEREKLRLQMVAHYHDTKGREHQRILAYHKIIEDRKAYLERLNTVREEEEARRAEEVARQQALAEQHRLEQKREERERKRQENEIQQIRDRHHKEKMQQISQTTHGQKILKKLDKDEIKKMDAEQIAAKEAEELQKERKEMQQRLKSQEKLVERAKRLEEIPLLQQAFKEKQEKMKIFEARIAEEHKKRLLERKIQRKEERRTTWICHREEEERLKREEEEKMKRDEEERIRKEEEKIRKEEEERIKREEKERLAAEKEEEYRKKKELADRQASIQRQREEEVQRKLAMGGGRGGGGGGGGGVVGVGGVVAAVGIGGGVGVGGGGQTGFHWRRGGYDDDKKADDDKDRSSWRKGGDSKSELWRSLGMRNRKRERDPGDPNRGGRDRGRGDRDRVDRDHGERDRDRGERDRDHEECDRGDRDRDRDRGERDRDRDFDKDDDRKAWRSGGRGGDNRGPPRGGSSFESRDRDFGSSNMTRNWCSKATEGDSDDRGPPLRLGGGGGDRVVANVVVVNVTEIQVMNDEIGVQRTVSRR